MFNRLENYEYMYMKNSTLWMLYNPFYNKEYYE